MHAARSRIVRCAAIALVILSAVGAMPVSAQEDLAVLRAQMERAWNSANWPAALALLDHMRTLAPQDAALIDREQRGRLNYGWDLLAAGMCSQARTQFERALGLLPGDAEALAGLALARARCPEATPVAVPTALAPGVTPTRVLPTPAVAQPVGSLTEYTVRRGDTLYSLARRFGITVAAIQQANGMSGVDIQAGATLMIPPPQEGQATAGSYTVQAGDTLYSLARRLGTTVQALMQANGLSTSDIRTGQVLVIPGGQGATTPVPTGRTHTVKRGETLYSLARQYGTTVAAIQAANGLAGTAITAGQVLVIP